MKKIFTYFRFDDRNAILKKEIIGGISTFLAMVYILAVNPAIVGSSLLNPGVNQDTAVIYQGGLFLATALSAFVGTLIMGLFANLPIGLAPGMGLNTFFAFNVASSIGFESALSVTILSGVLYFIVVMTPARDFISRKIPKNIKLAIGTGIGFFIAYLGLQSSNIIIEDPGPGLATKLNSFTNPMVILAVVLLFVGLILYYLKIPSAIIITMILGAIILLIMKVSGLKELKDINFLGSYSDFSTFPTVISSGWKGFANIKMWISPTTYLAILSFVYLDFFDTTGTLIALNKMVDLDEKDPNWIKKANNIDAISTIVGASIGATTVTSFVESVVGASAGAKTGFSNIIVALGFVLAIPAWPILQIFLPLNIGDTSYQPIVGPILIIVGTIMIAQIKFFEWEIAIDIPMLFLTIILMALSNSIAIGIGVSAITFVILNTAAGIYQLIRGKKRVVETISMNFAEDNPNLKTREFKYLKRLNWTVILVALFSLIFIIIEQVMH
ncbi:MAG: NCS2 family permease [Metamycoplasmataceae bacterium]